MTIVKHITIPKVNKLTAENFASRLAQANLAGKNDIVNFLKKTDFDDKLKHLNKKVTSNKTKHLLVENELKKLQTFDSGRFIGQSYFNNHGAQLSLILQLLYYTLKRLGDTEKVVSWKYKGLSAEKLTTPTTTNISLSPSIEWYENSNFCLIFKGNCLKQNADGGVGKNVIIFGIDMLILGKGPTQGLDDTMLIAESQYSINFSRSNRKFYLSL